MGDIADFQIESAMSEDCDECGELLCDCRCDDEPCKHEYVSWRPLRSMTATNRADEAYELAKAIRKLGEEEKPDEIPAGATVVHCGGCYSFHEPFSACQCKGKK
jgi:hypothetical protein